MQSTAGKIVAKNYLNMIEVKEENSEDQIKNDSNFSSNLGGTPSLNQSFTTDGSR